MRTTPWPGVLDIDRHLLREHLRIGKDLVEILHLAAWNARGVEAGDPGGQGAARDLGQAEVGRAGYLLEMNVEPLIDGSARDVKFQFAAADLAIRNCLGDFTQGSSYQNRTITPALGKRALNGPVHLFWKAHSMHDVRHCGVLNRFNAEIFHQHDHLSNRK
jgi:hypothetical protein